MGIAVGRRSWTGVGIGIGFRVGGVVVLHGVLVLFGCLVLQLLACIVMLSGA
jgi:hypothetical protein